jgi:phage tail tube protein FII
MEIDGAPIGEFDAMSNIYKVNGVDVAATYKINLGI